MNLCVPNGNCLLGSSNFSRFHFHSLSNVRSFQPNLSPTGRDMSFTHTKRNNFWFIDEKWFSFSKWIFWCTGGHDACDRQCVRVHKGGFLCQVCIWWSCCPLSRRSRRVYHGLELRPVYAAITVCVCISEHFLYIRVRHLKKFDFNRLTEGRMEGFMEERVVAKGGRKGWTQRADAKDGRKGRAQRVGTNGGRKWRP